MLDGYSTWNISKCESIKKTIALRKHFLLNLFNFYFQLQAITGVIKIGEPLSILVYLKDQKNQYDLKMRDCWAYDNEDFDLPGTNKLQLTDKEGCPK